MTDKVHSPAKISKSLGERLNELTEAMLVMRDCLTSLQQGKQYMLLPLYGQLRALIIETKTNTPLLISVAEELSHNLELYHMETDTKPPLPSGSYVHFRGPPFSRYKLLKNQRKSSLKDFIKLEMLDIQDKTYTLEYINSTLANKFGGAHFDPTIKHHDYLMTTLELGLNANIVKQLLKQVAEIIYDLGVDFLKSFSDFEIYMSIKLPRQDLKGLYRIAENSYPDSNAGAIIFMDTHLILHFRVTDTRGHWVQVDSQIPLEHGKTYGLGFFYRLDRSLNSELTVVIDGETAGYSRSENPTMTRNDVDWHDRRFNTVRPSEAEKSLSIMMKNFLIIGRESNWISRSDIFNYLSQLGEIAIWFKPGSEGYIKPGKRGMKITGEAILINKAPEPSVTTND